jgi:hypothetical protein
MAGELWFDSQQRRNFVHIQTSSGVFPGSYPIVTGTAPVENELGSNLVVVALAD